MIDINDGQIDIILKISRLLMDANAEEDEHAALQAPGHLYGDLSTTRENYVRHIVQNDKLADEWLYRMVESCATSENEVRWALQYAIDYTTEELIE